MDTEPIVTELDAEPRNARTSTLRSGRRASIELITRGEPRRRWSTEQKHAIAAESLSPGASPTKVARQHGISTGQLYTWRKALLAAQPRLARFARVEIAASAKRADQRTGASPLLAAPALQPVCRPSLIEIVLPNSTSVRVDAQIDPRALRRVLSVLSKQ
jgi:transposase